MINLIKSKLCCLSNRFRWMRKKDTWLSSVCQLYKWTRIIFMQGLPRRWVRKLDSFLFLIFCVKKFLRGEINTFCRIFLSLIEYAYRFHFVIWNVGLTTRFLKLLSFLKNFYGARYIFPVISPVSKPFTYLTLVFRAHCAICSWVYTAVSRKVVLQMGKSLRDNFESYHG